jgi:hypothetical protein
MDLYAVDETKCFVVHPKLRRIPLALGRLSD